MKEIIKNVRFAPLLAKNAPKVTKEEAQQRVTFTTDINNVSPCEFIIENVTEDWNLKEKIYKQLDQINAPEVCFGVNTSCISITKVGSITKRPAKVIGIHFMNPVHLKPTVEVIRGYHTSDETLEKINQLFAQLNKQAIVVPFGNGMERP